MTARARNTDPETSHAAAASVGDIRLSQAAVLRVIALLGGAQGMTDEELVNCYDHMHRKRGWPAQSPSGLRSRRAELVRLGLVEHTGEKRAISTGRMARLWRVTEKN